MVPISRFNQKTSSDTISFVLESNTFLLFETVEYTKLDNQYELIIKKENNNTDNGLILFFILLNKIPRAKAIKIDKYTKKFVIVINVGINSTLRIDQVSKSFLLLLSTYL